MLYTEKMKIIARHTFVNKFGKSCFQVSKDDHPENYVMLRKLKKSIDNEISTYNPVFIKKYNEKSYASVCFVKNCASYEDGEDYEIDFCAFKTEHKDKSYVNLKIRKAVLIRRKRDFFHIDEEVLLSDSDNEPECKIEDPPKVLVNPHRKNTNHCTPADFDKQTGKLLKRPDRW
jgi:hypothetical protein